MHPDYYHNPPNMRPPVHKYFYLIMFINNRNIQMKGQAVIYRRKTLDMLFDLINDLDQIYFHSDVEGDQSYLAEQTQNIETYCRILYTQKFDEVLHLINPDSYVIKCAWNEIPNCNPIPPPPLPPYYPRPHYIPDFHRHQYPPYPHEYFLKQKLFDSNQIIQRFGDQE